MATAEQRNHAKAFLKKAIVAGALGTGFETEDAVRQAAHSYRERERRSALQQSKDRQDEGLTDRGLSP